MKINVKKLIPYGIALGIISIILLVMFHPALEGKVIKQQDIASHKGMSHEISEYYKQNHEHVYWTNSMFGGMPAYLISLYHASNLTLEISKALKLYLPFFMGLIFLIFAGFYFLTNVLKIDPWISILGAVAFVLSSYFYIILEAGHNSKANAIGFMLPFLAAMIMTYRGKLIAGAILSALFLALEIGANHLQITYYLAFMALIYVIFEFVWSIQKKEMLNFFKASGLLIVAAILAVAINASLLYTTFEYSKETIRGKSELSKTDSKSDGLDTDYLTQWSYGIGETWSLLIPNAKGGGSKPIKQENKKLLKNVSPQSQQVLSDWSQYWGAQPFTSGPVYVGAVVMFLFILGLFISKNNLKWPLLVMGILSLMLAWGKHLPWLTDFFIQNVPLYNKFRAPAMWLVVVEAIVPLIMVIGLHELIINREKYTQKLHWLYISFGLTGGLALIFWLLPDAFFSFTNATDQKYFDMFLAQGATQPQIDNFAADLTAIRISIFKADAIRTFLFILAAAVLIWLFLKKIIKTQILIPALILLVLVDMVPINKRYLSEKNFTSKRKYEKPFAQTPADKNIMSLNNNQDRVLNLAVNTFNDASTSYYHQSVGGYHAAKLMRYQELIENQIQPEISMLTANLREKTSLGRIDSVLANLGVLNMLNTKYIILNPNAAPLINRHAIGHAWFVNKVEWVENSNEEILRVGEINPASTAVIDKRFESIVQGHTFSKDSTANIVRKSYAPGHLTYTTNSQTEQLAIFSEIYYPEWEMTIDGQPANIIRANYVLRAAVIPAGTHEIDMKMNPKIFKSSSKVSMAGSLVLIATLLGLIIYGFLQKKKRLDIEDETTPKA